MSVHLLFGRFLFFSLSLCNFLSLVVVSFLFRFQFRLRFLLPMKHE